MRFYLISVLSILLCGCGTSSKISKDSLVLTIEQEGMYKYFISQGLDKDAALVMAINPSLREPFFDDKTCQSYGAKPGSDAYVSCRAQLDVGHRITHQ